MSEHSDSEASDAPREAQPFACTYCGIEGEWLRGVTGGWACNECRWLAENMNGLGLAIGRMVQRAAISELVRRIIMTSRSAIHYAGSDAGLASKDDHDVAVYDLARIAMDGIR
jgi:ribosomal protein L37AE/L43A